MTVPARVSIVTLGVEDVARSTAFYEAWGWECAVAADDGFRLYRTDGALLTLYPRQSLAVLTGQPIDDGPPQGFRGVTFAINVATPAEVDEVVASAVRAGAALLRRPVDLDWGGRVSYVADPDGHVWEIAFNPTMPLGPDGLPQVGGA